MNHLNARQGKFVQALASGVTATEAAKRSGYSKKNAGVIAGRVKQSKKVKAVIATMQAEVRERIAFGMIEANNLIDESIRFARTHKHPMALAKSTEVKLKLNGLMIERIQEVPVDLRGALEQARMRIINAGRLDACTLDAKAETQAEPEKTDNGSQAGVK